MGKSKNKKLYISATEHKYVFGGVIPTITTKKYRQLPFHHCHLTLQPAEIPCMTRSGIVYDYVTILEFLKNNDSRDPINGQKLLMKNIKKLKFFKNSLGQFHCPVSRKVFTDYTKICAIWCSGNTYAYSTVKEMNIELNSWIDLKSSQSFTKDDIIVIQDPHNLFTTSVDDYWYYKKNKMKDKDKSETENDQEDILNVINSNKTTERIFSKLKEREKVKKEKNIELNEKVNEPNKKFLYTSQSKGENTMSASFTSTSMTTILKDKPKKETISDLRMKMYSSIQQMKSCTSFVTLNTTMGDLYIQLHCKYAPMACHNFLMLCEKGYYNDTIFHRLIPGFMIQGGDPNGNGTGGKSIFGADFKDEFHQKLKFDDIGIVAMANKGPNTNSSQFFITFKKNDHLYRKHTIFGRLVKGIEVLKAMEGVRVNFKNKPLRDIRIKSAVVLNNPFRDYVNKTRFDPERIQKKKEGNERGKWFSDSRVKVSTSGSGSGIGKYLKSKLKKGKKRKRKEGNVLNEFESKRKKVKKSHDSNDNKNSKFNFSNW